MAIALLPIVLDHIPKVLKSSKLLSFQKLVKKKSSRSSPTYVIGIHFYSDAVQSYEDFKGNSTRGYDDMYGEEVYDLYDEYILSSFSHRKFLDPIKDACRKHIAKEFPDLPINFGIYPKKVSVVETHGRNFNTLFEMEFKGHLSIR